MDGWIDGWTCTNTCVHTAYIHTYIHNLYIHLSGWQARKVSATSRMNKAGCAQGACIDKA